jgi:hypothetical protein
MRETGGRNTKRLVRKATTLQFRQAKMWCAVHISEIDRQVVEINL